MSINSDRARKRGRLKIYLGMSAGVGKTFAMLKDAQEDLKRGIDIVAGYIEPHGRKETEDLAKPFEAIATNIISHQGIELREFDLNAALKRSPHTILVDELAHTNAPGCVHNKRWLDIQSLLDAGINVYSTLNIQHLESVSELVASLTGVTVHETIPDSVLRQADSIEVIDIPPEELIDRLKSGKIYSANKVEVALSNFFKEGSLLALREVMLRKAAEKIDSDVLKFRQTEVIKESWASSDRMLVAIGPNRFAKRLVKKAGLIASSRKTTLTVVYVQTPHLGTLSTSDQNLVDEALQIAQGIGATIERRYGTDIVAEILKCAIDINAALILVGKPNKNKFISFAFGSLADELVRRSGNIDVVLVTGEADDATHRPLIVKSSRPRALNSLYAILIVVACTFVGIIVEPVVELTTIAMLYILGAVFIARGSSRMESVAASILSVLCFNFFFIAPKYSLDVHNPEYIVTFIAMLAVSLSISGLIARIRLQNLIVSKREKRALTLYDAGREINKAQNQSEILLSTQNSILRLGDLDCGILLYNDHALHTGVSSRSFFELEAEEFAVAKFVMDRKEAAGYSTETLPGAAGLYLPLKTERNLYGVCAISPLIDGKNQERLDIEVRQTIELILQQAALCLERLTLELNARETQIKIETEGMRSLILSSVSHDFRTPLTVIEGAAEQINLSSESSSTTKELAKLILDHGHRLSRVVHNALSFAKLEGKAPKLNLEWESIEELIGQAIEKYRDKLKNREIKIEYPEDLPLIRVDAVLIDQLIVNVLENSLIHAKTATYLGIKVELEENTLIITISDNGPGLQGVVDGNKLMQDTDSHTGSGIGVKICELITKLHSGSFELKAGMLGGVESIIRLPLNATKPSQTPFAETAGHDN